MEQDYAELDKELLEDRKYELYMEYVHDEMDTRFSVFKENNLSDLKRDFIKEHQTDFDNSGLNEEDFIEEHSDNFSDYCKEEYDVGCDDDY